VAFRAAAAALAVVVEGAAADAGDNGTNY